MTHWVIIEGRWPEHACHWTVAQSRAWSQKLFIERQGPQGHKSWKAAYRAGFRAVKCRIVIESQNPVQGNQR